MEAFIDFAAVVLAGGLDRALGEPPARLHPVVGLGRLIAALDHRAPDAGPLARLSYGAAMAAGTVAAAVATAAAVERLARKLPCPLTVALVAVALKPAFAWRALAEHAERVATPLERGDLPAARQALAMIVSRPTATLDAPRVAAAAIESLAENASDSIVAPLVWYVLGGLPGAWAYRAANTLDAMVGYRSERYEWLGKPAARLDDALNWLPARLTALLFVLAAAAGNGSAGAAWRIARRDHAATASPNAGWPMAALAGALSVELEKVDHYRLGAGMRAPEVADLRRALRVFGAVAPAAVAAAALTRGWRAGLHHKIRHERS